MRTLLALGSLALACAPAGPAPAGTPATPPVTAPAPAASRPLAPELAGLVEPWHPLDAALADRSPVWLLTRYAPGTYPCRPGPDGSLDMLQQDRFEIVRVLRGAAAAPGVDLDLYNLRGPSYPGAWAEGRRYLLFLRPGPEAQAILADPEHLGAEHARLGRDDVLAVLDLDVGRAEADAEVIAATRTGEHGGVRWDPAFWDALRRTAPLDPAQQREMAAFLERVVLRPGAPLHEVRAWLGPPDDRRLAPGGARVDHYILARPAYDTPTEGALYGDLKLHFGADLTLRRAALMYLRWHVQPHQRSSIALTPEEHAREGLPRWDERR